MSEIHHAFRAMAESGYDARARLEPLINDLIDALEPFAHLTKVMHEGAVLNWRGVYITWEQAQAAADAIAKAKEE